MQSQPRDLNPSGSLANKGSFMNSKPNASSAQQPGFEDQFDERFSQMSVSTMSVHDFPLRNTDMQDNTRFKGQIVNLDRSMFDEVTQSKLSVSHQRRFKISNMQRKCILLESPQIQIGIKSGLIYDYMSQRQHLKLELYFGNKTQAPIHNFQVEYQGSETLDVWTKPQVVEAEIQPKRQVKQELLVQFNNLPYSLISCELEAVINNTSQVTTTIFLPNLLTQYMNYKKCDVFSFKKQWKYKEENILRTE